MHLKIKEIHENHHKNQKSGTGAWCTLLSGLDNIPPSLDLESIFRKSENIGHFAKFSFVYAHKCYLALFRTFFSPDDPYIQAPDLFSISEAYIALY